MGLFILDRTAQARRCVALVALVGWSTGSRSRLQTDAFPGIRLRLLCVCAERNAECAVGSHRGHREGPKRSVSGLTAPLSTLMPPAPCMRSSAQDHAATVSANRSHHCAGRPYILSGE